MEDRKKKNEYGREKRHINRTAFGSEGNKDGNTAKSGSGGKDDKWHTAVVVFRSGTICLCKFAQREMGYWRNQNN